uniref:Uncharacterized protein n=1 Tax=Anguilla anguilla TaxID=7936 RepID=A0A0E9R6D4_ANGAN
MCPSGRKAPLGLRHMSALWRELIVYCHKRTGLEKGPVLS